MSSDVIIIGTGAHARKVWHYCRLAGHNISAFLDENLSALSPAKEIPCLHPNQQSNIISGQLFFVAIGNRLVRRKLQMHYRNLGWIPISLIHPSAYVAFDAKVGEGTVICAQAVIETGCHVGDGCIIDIGATVDHDSVIDEYSHVRSILGLPPFSRFSE
jgi:hypothetical protein